MIDLEEQDDWGDAAPIEEFEDVGDAELEPPRWVVRNFLPTGITFLAGPPKSQKSTLALALGLVVTGHEVPNWDPEFRTDEPGRLLGWSAEATAGELRHVAKHGLGVAVRNDGTFLIHKNPFQYRLDDPDGGRAMLRWLSQHRPKLALIDPLRDFHALDEKDDGAMNRLLRPLQKWAKDESSSVLVVHHARKRGELTAKTFGPEDMRGTSALFGLADGILMTTPQGSLGITVNATFKRGSPWERTIKIGKWVAAGPQTEPLVVDAAVRDIYRALRAGATSSSAIATQVGVRKGRVLDAFALLEAHGMLVRAGPRKVPELTGDFDARIKEEFEKWFHAEGGEDHAHGAR